MNDYSFGNRLLRLRTEAGLTQTELGRLVDVSGKVVSKWETGKAKPGVEALRKLSAVFRVPVEELLRLREETGPATVHKIVITGVPCAGKTTAMSWIQNAFTKQGYAVLFVPETATELISGGVAPWTCGSNLDYQRCQVALQLEKERIFQQAAGSMAGKKIRIVCDRGVLDNRAYMSEADFACILRELGHTEVELRDGYDAVFHLVTAAKGAEAAYTCANNQARTETVAEAAALDDRLLAAWTGHPHLRVIDNSTDFEDKMKRLIAEISAFLGEPEPLEIERKFLIEYPDLGRLEKLPNCRRVEIIQTYLQSADGEEVRVRQRGADGSYIYYETVKRPISAGKRVEIERRLTQDEYLRRLMDADTHLRPIRKTSYCLTWENRYLELDIYPFWQDKAILEIELRDENEEISLPGWLHVIREVTGDSNYANRALAGRREGARV